MFYLKMINTRKTLITRLAGILLTVFISAQLFAAKPDEGMWPLTMIAKLEDKMQARGLKLSAEDIYSINKSSLKDAVVRLTTKQGRMFCTGEIISSQGLFLTNHHCGYGAIQELSSPQDNILSNGFWAKDRTQERPANFNIMLLAKIEDVTSQVIGNIQVDMEEAARSAAISQSLAKVRADLMAASKDYTIEIVPFYNGNKYLAMFYEVFSDIRLVGTPPENMGKFGGDTDNWMWPRHTADFSLFRIYVGKDNKPAEYSPDNIPYTPKHFFPVSTAGISAGDYAMIMGYPGRTDRYRYSAGIKYTMELDRPVRVNIRRAVLDQYEAHMKTKPEIRLMYADKHATMSNYWKKFMGERDGLRNLNIYDRRKEVENEFKNWYTSRNLTAKYGSVFDLYESAYAAQSKTALFGIYLSEAIFNSQPISISLGFTALSDSLNSKNKATVSRAIEEARKEATTIGKSYTEYYAPIEKGVLEVVLKMTNEGLPAELQPEAFKKMVASYKGNTSLMAEKIFATSLFTDSSRLKNFLNKPIGKVIANDPILVIANAFIAKNRELAPTMAPIMNNVNRAGRLFLAGLMEKNPEMIFNPDANATMRLTYGRVLDYEAKDAVRFNYLTTHKGILEKYIPGDYEFDAPQRLIDLIKKEDFGPWKDKNGNLPICFLTDNDITGGNSGSPVINARGELIGTAFDGNWEAISSDFAFEPNLQRTINLDIRYTLFIIDKFAGAQNIINELKLVGAPAPEPPPTVIAEPVLAPQPPLPAKKPSPVKKK
jgi:hypothetical protein